jgi:hypothetical protein
VTYEFIDARQCPVGTLTVLIGTGEGATGIPPETQPSQICMTISAVQEQPGFLFFSGSTTEIAARITVNDSVRETAFQLCGALRERFLLIAEEVYWTVQKEQIPFERWELFNTSSEAWETVSEEPFLSVTLVNGAHYRAVYAEGPVIRVTPTPTQPSETTRPCLTVGAIFAYQTIGTAMLRTTTTPQIAEEPISVQITVNRSQYRMTEFTLCGDAGTTLTLQAPEEHYTEQEARLAFSHWERYNDASSSWSGFSESPALQITLQQGGQLRAVYQQAESLY